MRLTVAGRPLTQPLILKMDPRIKTPPEGLRAQFDRSMEVGADMARTLDALHATKAEHAKVTTGARAKGLADRESKLTDLNGKLTALYTSLQEVDAAPTAAMVDAAAELRRQVSQALESAQRPPAR